jgi:hypothetical protein
MKKIFFAAIAFVLTAGMAQAQEAMATPSDWGTTSVFKDVGVTLKGGTVGGGVDFTKSINESFKVRAGYSTFKYDDTYTESEIDFDGKLQIGGWNLLGDWHPWASGWRVTGGVYGPSHKISGSGKFNTLGTIDVNGTTYSSTDLSSLDMAAKWNGVRPYLGFGYDGFNSAKAGGFFFSADVGVIFSGSPKFSLTANCTNPALCSALATDLAAEEAQINSDLNDAKYLPVVQIGVGYRF